MNLEEMIKHNLGEVEERITRACERAKRDRREIQLIAVSKTFPAEAIVAAYKAGLRSFGENRVQEAAEKIRAFCALRGDQPERMDETDPPKIRRTFGQIDGIRPAPQKARVPPRARDLRDLRFAKNANLGIDRTDHLIFHLIGHLQSNKAKLAAQTFDMVQTLDRIEIAQKLDRFCEPLNRLLPVLIQLNLGNEETKSGVEPSQTMELVRQVAALSRLRVRGLMAIPPFRDDPEASRADFRLLKKMAQEVSAARIPNVSMSELSMGMSHDFEVAIEEGATMIRVGTAIFGKRTPQKLP